MRKLAFVGVALAALSVAQAASAVSQVWFTAVGNNSSSTVTTQGTQGGEPLGLLCNVTAVPTSCAWTVTMMLNTPTADPAVSGWHNDFTTPSGPKLIMSNLVIPASPFPVADQGLQGPGPQLSINSGASTFGTPFNGQAAIATFVLTKNKLTIPPPNGQDWLVATDIGDFEWGDTSPTGLPQVQFANNPAIQAAGGNNGGTVIIGRNIPEPATLSLVAVGLLGLLRRRR